MKETKLYTIEYDETGYVLLAVQPDMRMITFDRGPEWEGPNLTHRKTWFNESGELESKANVYDTETDEEYKELYKSGFFDTLPKFSEHKDELFQKYKQIYPGTI